ncbi:Transcriptional activator of the JUN family [Scheffersomyces stipitis CBS 6054]|uniref:Transcriptional activator of the JUN family n=1 Tax=Scheffersomyces stipitis (strain ATCC 58785 / CBS 6054 / NBRC 10063 / NRRL Y-11545) TaxID=322104 RepID=A3GG71_PICST|nr:Transcriptional activator of the JUN family [Scheffersomyces stipitis CBS 6054]EAZ63886.2 Transcriptional activator of the JUN family [Scheffersomyces stipitis CBS 6054]KAG2735856.1 hypothetical protein G9P44_002070 [Scheffersomyces stipitis]
MAPNDQSRKERKRLQNKISQRKHRARQADRIQALEEEVKQLRHANQESAQFARILTEIRTKVSTASSALKELDQFLSLKLDVFDDCKTVSPMDEASQTRSNTNALETISPNTSVSSTTPSPKQDVVGSSGDINTPQIATAEIANRNEPSSHSVSIPVDAYQVGEPILPLQTSTTIIATGAPLITSTDLPESTPISGMSGSPIILANDPVNENIVLSDSYSSKIHTPHSISAFESFFHPSIMSLSSYFTPRVFDNIESSFRSSVNDIISKHAELGPSTITNQNMINVLVDYAETILEQLPGIQGFTLALGGFQWVCGQLLLILCERPELRFLRHLLFPDNPSQENNKVMQKMLVELEKRLRHKYLKDHPSMSSISQYHISSPRVPVLFPGFFKPTALQEYYLENNIPYKHLINFIVWPEFRDALLRNADQMEFSGSMDEVMDNVVIRMTQSLQPEKLFFVQQLKDVITLEMQQRMEGVSLNMVPNISSAELVNAGITNPNNWKLTRSYGFRYSKVVPSNLIVEDIDDTDPNMIIRPVLVSQPSST